MAKVRIYALAKELGLTNDELIRELNRMGLDVDSALSTIEEEVADQVRGGRGRESVEVTKVEEKKRPSRKKKKTSKAEKKKKEEAAKRKAAKKKAEEEAEEKKKAKAKKEKEKKAAAKKKAEEEKAEEKKAESKPTPKVRRVRRGPSPEERARQLQEAAAAEEEAAAEAAAEEEAVAEAAAEAEEEAPAEAPAVAEPEVVEAETEEAEEAEEEEEAASSSALKSTLADVVSEAHGEEEEEEAPAEPAAKEAAAEEAVPEPAEAEAAESQAEAAEEPKLRLKKKDPSQAPDRSGRRLVRRTPGSSPPGVKRVRKVRKVITTGKLPPKTEESKQKKRRRQQEPAAEVGEVRITEGMTVKDLADKLQRKTKDLQAKLFEMGLMVSINQALDTDTASQLVEAMGATPEVVSFEEDLVLEEVEEEKEVELQERPPVVAVMGHVDHGKTSLLDAIRESNVVTRESGGITQHIGAYRVRKDGKYVTFLDTPGHEAFTLMRLRGADATDIVILVVAADDGLMPQTLESINHARAANKPILVAINKIDKPDADPERVMRQLGEQDLLPEDWGGETITVRCSAQTKEGIDQIIEMVLLQAELMELKAAEDRSGSGSVLEARLDRARGAVATVLVQDGTLRVGDTLLAGPVMGKVRAMFDEHGNQVKEAGPSTPVEVLGLGDVPEAGDQFQVVPDEARARKMAEFRQEKQRKQQLGASARMTLDQLYQKIQEEGVKELPLIIKADVQGSVEVLRKALEDLSTEQVRVNIIHAASGPISESDVLLATTSGAIIVGFNVRPEKNARALAEEEGIDIRLHTVIYHITDEIEKAMVGLLEPEEKEIELGRAEVRETFKVPKIGIVAGCHVSEGQIERSAQARLLRDNVVIWEGNIASLRRFKDDVTEVRSGFECGIGLESYQDIKPGDEIEAFRVEKVQVQTLT